MVGLRVGAGVGRLVVGLRVERSVGAFVGGIAQYETKPQGETPFHLNVIVPAAPEDPAMTCMNVPTVTRGLLTVSGMSLEPE